jgi:phenylacetate-CoA ligase
MIKNYLSNVLLSLKGLADCGEYRKIISVPSEQLAAMQDKLLTDVLLHADKMVPYYHNIFQETRLISGNKIIFSNFSNVRFLTKRILRESQESLRSKDYITRRWYANSSGGSTGEPTKFIQDNIYLRWERAAVHYWYNNIIGIDDSKVKKVILWGSERDLFQGGIGWQKGVFNWLTNTVFLNSFKMTSKDMDHYIESINRVKPDIVSGYAGSLFELCKYAREKGRFIYEPKVVISQAEILSEDMRNTISSVFGCKVYDFYGSREASALAGECKFGNKHILSFHNYIEILDDDNNPVKEGQEGRVILTNLHNYSMPFIRYVIGDRAIKGTANCPCGSPLPCLKQITGRLTERFILENGTTVPAEYFIHLIGVVCNKGFIRRFQIIQESYLTIRILVVLERTMASQEMENINDKIKLVMGSNCKVIWEFVDEIQNTPQGKYQYTKSLVQ